MWLSKSLLVLPQIWENCHPLFQQVGTHTHTHTHARAHTHTHTDTHTHTHLVETGSWPVFSAAMSHIHKHTLTRGPTAAMTPAMVKNILNGIVSSEVIARSARWYPLTSWEFTLLTLTLQRHIRDYFNTHPHSFRQTHDTIKDRILVCVTLCGCRGSWCLDTLLSILWEPELWSLQLETSFISASFKVSVTFHTSWWRSEHRKRPAVRKIWYCSKILFTSFPLKTSK